MNKNTTLAIVFLVAGTLLTTGVVATLSTVTTTTMRAYAVSGIDLIPEMHSRNNDGNQAIADTDCHMEDVVAIDGDVIQNCDSSARNRETTTTTTIMEEPEPEPEPGMTCEECYEAFLTPEEIAFVEEVVTLPLEEICDAYATGEPTLDSVRLSLLGAPFLFSEDVVNPLIECLEDWLNG